MEQLTAGRHKASLVEGNGDTSQVDKWYKAVQGRYISSQMHDLVLSDIFYPWNEIVALRGCNESVINIL